MLAKREEILTRVLLAMENVTNPSYIASFDRALPPKGRIFLLCNHNFSCQKFFDVDADPRCCHDLAGADTPAASRHACAYSRQRGLASHRPHAERPCRPQGRGRANGREIRPGLSHTDAWRYRCLPPRTCSQRI